MFHEWIGVLREKWKKSKEDPKIRRLLLKLNISMTTIVAYAIITALHIEGAVGLLLRGGCIGILLYVMVSLYTA